MKDTFYISGKHSLYGLMEYIYSCGKDKEDGVCLEEERFFYIDKKGMFKDNVPELWLNFCSLTVNIATNNFKKETK